ncbi:MAG TPA: hypothetical protein VNQ76_17155 [Planctomicrobium sp.]|nr:hypothetical protein [Planctomicrobium sp.]
MIQNNDIQFIHLAMRFPALYDADGISPWNPDRLDTWAAEETDEPAAVAATQFLLSSWNPSCQWQCGAFDAQRACTVWDPPHRLAYFDWASRKSLMN